MADSNLGTKVGYLLAGAGIGAVIALLFAPKSGEDTRKFIAAKAEEGKDYMASKGKELREAAEDLVDRGREVATKQKERLADTLESGRRVARNTFAR